MKFKISSINSSTCSIDISHSQMLTSRWATFLAIRKPNLVNWFTEPRILHQNAFNCSKRIHLPLIAIILEVFLPFWLRSKPWNERMMSWGHCLQQNEAKTFQWTVAAPKVDKVYVLHNLQSQDSLAPLERIQSLKESVRQVLHLAVRITQV